MHHSIGDTHLSPLELQIVFVERANISNKRLIGLPKPRSDRSYKILTPIHLLLGRSSSILPGDAELSDVLLCLLKQRLVNQVTTAFWRKWINQVAPRLVLRQKLHQKTSNLRIGDLIMIYESSQIKAKYKFAMVEAAHTSPDGCSESVQRLVLLLPTAEQEKPLEVDD